MCSFPERPVPGRLADGKAAEGHDGETGDDKQRTSLRKHRGELPFSVRDGLSRVFEYYRRQWSSGSERCRHATPRTLLGHTK